MSFSFAINRKHCRFCNVFFHTCCARAHACVRARVCVCVCVCVCVVVGDGGGQIYSKSSRWGAGGGDLANVAPIVDKLFKKLSRFSSKTQVTPLIFTSKSTFSEHLHASVRSHHTHFKTHGPGVLSLN